MRCLSLVHLPLHRVCLQAVLQVAADFHGAGLQAADFQEAADFHAAGLQAADFHAAAGLQAADFHAAGSQAVDFHAAAGSQAAGLHAPADSTARRCPGVGSAVQAVVPGRRPLRAPRIFPGQGLAGQEAWLRKTTSRAAGISHRNCHRQFNPFLKGADRFYRQLLKATSRDQDRRARDFLIFQEKAPV